MSDKNTSTLQSYIDSATGTVQSVIGSITGNASDQVSSLFIPLPIPLPTSSTLSAINFSLTLQQNEGDAKQNKAKLENEASHATAKVGPFSASTSGAVTKDDPNRSDGSWNQTIGSTKSAVGGLVGSEVRSLCNLHAHPLPLPYPQTQS